MFVAQARQHLIENPAMQPDFPALVGHVTAAMEQINKIPNIPIISQGTQFLDLLHAIQQDLKKVHETVDDTNLIVHRLSDDMDEVRLTLTKVRLDAEETRTDLNQIKQGVKQLEVTTNEMRNDMNQLKQDTQAIQSE